jgi:hypothetical protein
MMNKNKETKGYNLATYCFKAFRDREYPTGNVGQQTLGVPDVDRSRKNIFPTTHVAVRSVKKPVRNKT